jgi:5'-methylthioadenosine phosphorylase
MTSAAAPAPAACFRVVNQAAARVHRRMKVAFISGTSIVNSTLFSSWDVKTVETKYGPVTYKSHGDHALINRHGYRFPLPPHSINYRANISALAALGFQDIVSLNSVGSLKKNLPPGTFVSCSDYVCFQQGPQTFFDDELKGGAPGIANNLIPRLVAELAPEFMIKTGMVYVQMRGPRFETKAEIRVVKEWGDVIGMTAAHEADLCTEVGLRYNSLALIDNFANGLEGTEIDFAKFKDLVKDNQSRVNRLFQRMLEILA